MARLYDGILANSILVHLRERCRSDWGQRIGCRTRRVLESLICEENKASCDCMPLSILCALCIRLGCVPSNVLCGVPANVYVLWMGWWDRRMSWFMGLFWWHCQSLVAQWHGLPLVTSGGLIQAAFEPLRLVCGGIAFASFTDSESCAEWFLSSSPFFLGSPSRSFWVLLGSPGPGQEKTEGTIDSPNELPPCCTPLHAALRLCFWGHSIVGLCSLRWAQDKSLSFIVSWGIVFLIWILPGHYHSIPSVPFSFLFM